MMQTRLMLFLALAAFSSHALANWSDDAKRYFEADEYQKCIDVAKPHKSDNQGLMFLTFSYLQRYVFTDTKVDKKQFKSYMELLEDKVDANDIDSIYYFAEQRTKPRVVKYANNLVKEAFGNINDISMLPRVYKFLHSEDGKTKKLTLKTMLRILKPKRKYVKRGGTLRKKDIAIFTDAKLIKALLNNISESKARSILVMIEEPVLKYLPAYRGKDAIKLEAKLTKAIQKRKKNYPNSTWYSATGETRVVSSGNL